MTIVVSRYLIPRGDLGDLAEIVEWTEDVVWLSRTARCRRLGLRGVPMRRVDLLIEDGILDGAADDLVVVEIGRKPGRYDGAIRDRIAFRARHPGLAREVASLVITATPDAVTMTVGDWTGTWPRLRSDLSQYNLARVVMWHWRRYYTHLPEEIVRPEADTFALEHRAQVGEWTLAEANRAASRALYALSRREGWSKLTLRERTDLGRPDASQWQHESILAVWRAERWPDGRYSGCSETTQRWAFAPVAIEEEK